MRNRITKYHVISILSFLVYLSVNCQATKKAISLKDSLDGKFDLSDYIIDANGFVPVPYIITEPALGGFGGALFPVFITKRPRTGIQSGAIYKLHQYLLISPAEEPSTRLIKHGELLHFVVVLL